MPLVRIHAFGQSLGAEFRKPHEEVLVRIAHGTTRLVDFIKFHIATLRAYWGLGGFTDIETGVQLFSVGPLNSRKWLVSLDIDFSTIVLQPQQLQ